MRKAIIFTAYDRVEYLHNTLKAWEKVRNIHEYDFFFSVEPSDHRDAICDVISNFEEHTGLSTIVWINYSKLGNPKNTFQCFDELFKDYDFVILAEDDVTPSEDICDYFTYLESKYKDVEDVAIISANTKENGIDPEAITLNPYFNGLIWGTWKKYWDQYFRDTWEFDYTSQTPGGWDWNLTLRVLPKYNLFTVHPNMSRSQHIGLNGLHCTPDLFEGTQSPSFRENHIWKELVQK